MTDYMNLCFVFFFWGFFVTDCIQLCLFGLFVVLRGLEFCFVLFIWSSVKFGVYCY